ncbi:MAG: type I-B CRISPR-associated protein Cas7/Cst2/DevR [Thermoplasmata archaeon]
MTSDNLNKGLEIVYLTKIEGANLNSNGTEGVISVLKKVRDPVDMKEYIRVSGQSVKYQLRQILKDLDFKVSQVISRQESGEKVIVSEGNPQTYIDDDLFGYMIAKKENNRNITKKRTAPVRTNGLISIFPYQEDRDFGVRYDPTGDQHNIFETEIATNIMRGNFFIELDRVGKFTSEETEKDSELPIEEREKRIKALLSAIQIYYGGAHLSRFFTKTYPEVMVVVFLNRKIPVIGDNLRIKQEYKEGKYILDTALIKEIYETFSEYINKMYIGIIKEKFANINEIENLENEKIKVLSLMDLKDTLAKEKIY